jgi:hypothetical protein
VKGGGWARGWVAVAIVATLAACFLLTWPLWTRDQNGAERANILQLPVGLLSLVVAVVALWRGRVPVASDRVIADLVTAVRRDRQRFLDQALAARWTSRPAHVTFTDPRRGSISHHAEALLLNWQDVDTGVVGAIDNVAKFFLGLPEHRMVVLGAPGAGKTVLLSRLILDLIDRFSALPIGERAVEYHQTPVLLDLATCSLGEVTGRSPSELADRLTKWMADRLVDDYQVPFAHAQVLVRQRYILPVLDGLDEMDGHKDDGCRTQALAVVQALSVDRFPVVVACRDLDYQSLTQSPRSAASPALLTDARHVVLQPLDAKAVIEYLLQRFGGRSEHLPPRWRPIAEAIEAGDPLLDVLSSPWQLFLAITHYMADTSNPAAMLGRPRIDVERELLSSFVPAVIDYDDVVSRNSWTADVVEQWLRTIATHQHRNTLSRADIQLTDLWRVSGSPLPQWIQGLITAGLLLWIAATPTALPQSPATWVVSLTIAYLTVFWLRVSHIPVWKQTDGISLTESRLGIQELVKMGLVELVFAFIFGLAIAAASPQGAERVARAFGGAGVLSYILQVLFWIMIWWWTRVFLGGLIATFVLLTAILAGSRLDHLAITPIQLVGQALLGGLLFALLVGAANEIKAGISVASRSGGPLTLLVRWRVGYAFTAGLIGGLVGGLGGWFNAGFEGSLELGLAAGLAAGLVGADGWVWLQYGFGTLSAAHRGLLPSRPARFLDWCHRVGIMRMSGNSIQFRHRELEDSLVRRDA